MAAKYAVTSKEEGRGKATRRTFSKLADLQRYVKDRWEGADYIDGPADFHGDYATFHLVGCTLADLGKRAGAHGTDEYFEWNWHSLTA